MVCLVLRLGGPLQSWGTSSEFNRRETDPGPSKSGIVGLLAAAHGRRRHDPIEDLLGLRMGVRHDQPGSLLRDFHTVSDHRGRPLSRASVDRTGAMRRTSPAKHVAVTTRFYLQDAIFVGALEGPRDLLEATADALRAPGFPLALGRRSCPPTLPLLLPAPTGDDLWDGDLVKVLRRVPWQATGRRIREGGARDVPATVDDIDGDAVRFDVPVSFDPHRRGFTSRRVRQIWISVGEPVDADTARAHDPFELLEG